MENVVIIDIRYLDDKLSISAHEQFLNQPNTIEFIEDLSNSFSQINDHCLQLFNRLNKVNTSTQNDTNIVEYVKFIGESLFDRLFTLSAKELLHNTQCQELILKIDGNLAQIPWELLYDGTNFLCQKFNIGRMVRTRHTKTSYLIRNQQQSKPLKILILADPKGDLDASYEEGLSIINKIKYSDRYENFEKDVYLKLKTSLIETEFIKQSLREFDIIHYAGHAKYESEDPSKGGWQTADGELTTADILQMRGGAPLPLLIFSNACQSGRIEPWSITCDREKNVYSQANAFLLAGVQHYIGTFCNIPDKQSKHFALEFYQNLLLGMPIGQALRDARLHLIKKYNDENITWMSYMLYGDPTHVYFGQDTFPFDEPSANTSDTIKKKRRTLNEYKPEDISQDNQEINLNQRRPRNPFKYHGHLDSKKNSLTYIDRKKQMNQVLNGIYELNYYAIMAPRQTGKTTFMQQIINKLSCDELYAYTRIYITLEDLIALEKSEFYSQIGRKIIGSLQNEFEFDSPHLLEMPEKIKSNLGLEELFLELSKAQLRNKNHNGNKKKILKYVILIDEIDAIGNLALEFLRTIRAIHELRSFVKGYDCYSFIISGALDLAQLSLGKTSPFNIAEPIYLEDFESEEVSCMIEKAIHEIGMSYYKTFPEEVFKVTNGHPCLIQKLCGKIIDTLILDNRDCIQKKDLTQQIEKLTDDFDITLRTTWEKLKNSKNMDILKRVFHGEKIKYNVCDEFSYELKLAGAIVKDEKGFCKIRNPIYEKFFSQQFDM